MSFQNLEQRLAQNYLDTLAPFVPDEAAAVSVSEQEQFYMLMQSLYRLAFDEPLLFVPTLHEDDAFPNQGTMSAYGKPRLMTEMKKFTRAMDSLLSGMFSAGRGEAFDVNRRQADILQRLGIDDLTHLPAAWIWMASRESANLLFFSRCFFRRDYSYVTDIYSRLLGEAAFRRLEAWMLAQGYERFDIYDIMTSDWKLSLTIANRKWSPSVPIGGSEYKIRHTGIAAKFEPYLQNPTTLSLCIPGGLKVFLEAFDSMDNNLQSFVVNHTKHCDNCRYCVQTDKTGRRPLARVAVTFGLDKLQLCPYFPGFSYRWTSLDDDLVDSLIGMLSFMDRFAPEQNKSRYEGATKGGTKTTYDSTRSARHVFLPNTPLN